MHRRIAFIFLPILCWFAAAVTLTCLDHPYAVNSLRTYAVGAQLFEPGEVGFFEDSQDQSGRQSKNFRYRLRCLLNRSFETNALPCTWESIAGYLPQYVEHLYTKYDIRTATLPAYYSFLFRLSPF